MDPCTQDPGVSDLLKGFASLVGPNQLGVDFNARLLQSFAQHVAPALGWESNREGPVSGHAI